MYHIQFRHISHACASPRHILHYRQDTQARTCQQASRVQVGNHRKLLLPPQPSLILLEGPLSSS